MISMAFCGLCVYMLVKMMGVILRASGKLFKIGICIIAAPLLICAFLVSGMAVLLVIMFIFAGLVCLLGLL